MKKILLLSVLCVLLSACGGGQGFKGGQTVYVYERCIGAVDEDSFDEMTRLCVRKDEQGLEIMDGKGLISILEYGQKGVVTETGFGKVKIRLENGREYWCSSEFLR